MKWIAGGLIAIFCFSLPVPVAAQPSTQTSSPAQLMPKSIDPALKVPEPSKLSVEAFDPSWESVPRDLLSFSFSPFNSLFKQHPWWVWTIPTGLLFAFDSPLRRSAEREVFAPLRRSLHDSPFPDAFGAGHKTLWMFRLLHWSAYLGFATENSGLTHFGVVGSEIIIDAWIFSQGLKHIFGRSRPEPRSTDGPYDFFNIETNVQGEHTSFPSTHATVYFSFGLYMGKVWQNELLGHTLGAGMYFLETGRHDHWVSDIFVSYLIASAIVNYVWNKHQHRVYKPGDWVLYPVFLAPNNLTYPGFGLLTFF